MLRHALEMLNRPEDASEGTKQSQQPEQPQDTDAAHSWNQRDQIDPMAA
jgi:hypothetical protein